MAELPDVFRTEDHEEMKDFEVMPIDKPYLGEVIKSEVKATKAGTGLRANFQVKILESAYEEKDGSDKYAGRLVFIGLNVKNPNPEAVRISQTELKSMSIAMNIDGDVEDTDEYHEIPFGFLLKVSKSEGYPDKNEIKKYFTEEEYKRLT